MSKRRVSWLGENGVMAQPRLTIDEMLAAARARLRRLRPVTVQAEQIGGAVVVDIRCESDRRRTGVIGGSVAIERSVLEWRADPDSPWRDPRIADLDRRLILICSDGYSSSLAAVSLLDLGFRDVTDVDGGITAWIAEGLPLEPSP